MRNRSTASRVSPMRPKPILQLVHSQPRNAPVAWQWSNTSVFQRPSGGRPQASHSAGHGLVGVGSPASSRSRARRSSMFRARRSRSRALSLSLFARRHSLAFSRARSGLRRIQSSALARERSGSLQYLSRFSAFLRSLCLRRDLRWISLILSRLSSAHCLLLSRRRDFASSDIRHDSIMCGNSP